jgi:DNA-binding NarL/FixJ family response regulator
MSDDARINSSPAPSDRSRAVRVGIVEDHSEIRLALATLIDGTPGFSCGATFRTMEDAVARVDQDLPDVMLVDIGLPGMSGIEGIRILKERHPDLSLLMLTVYDDDDRIFEALCAGACGYLLKKTPPARLLECIEQAASGGAPMSPEVARRVISVFHKYRPPPRAQHDLTPHEVRLLRLLVEGHNYTTAADELGVSYNTISFHMRNIYQKLQVHSKSEAVARALRDGIIQ